MFCLLLVCCVGFVGCKKDVPIVDNGPDSYTFQFEQYRLNNVGKKESRTIEVVIEKNEIPGLDLRYVNGLLETVDNGNNNFYVELDYIVNGDYCFMFKYIGWNSKKIDLYNYKLGKSYYLDYTVVE